MIQLCCHKTFAACALVMKSKMASTQIRDSCGLKSVKRVKIGIFDRNMIENDFIILVFSGFGDLMVQSEILLKLLC